MSERMDANFTLTAVRFPSGTTARYAGSLARLALNSAASFNFGAIDSVAPTLLTPRVDASLIAGVAATWTAGAAIVSAPVAISRASSPDGPYGSVKIGFAPSDPDAVALDPAAINLDADNSGSAERAQIGAATAVRFGRLRLQNANGSQLLALPIPIQAQYWNGTGFVTNTLDSCTIFTTANVALGNYQVNLNAGETTVTMGGAFSGGIGSLQLTAPGAGNNGSVDVSVNLTSSTAGASCTAGMPASTGTNRAYLQGAWCGATYVNDPTARAAFGVYKGADRFIYQRENY
jgi:MSHA biogenesis protein MshQ